MKETKAFTMLKMADLTGKLFLVGLFVFVPNLAFSQEEEGVLEEVYVTAQKREQSLMEVPVALQAFSGAELDKRGLGDLTRFINEIPGASTNLSWGPAITQVQLRGSGITGQQGSAAVAFYIDDVPFSIPNAQLAPISNMFDLERVEVLRGPQGTLWGLGSLGGTIRYITPDPDLTGFSGKFRGEISTMDDGGTGYRGDAMINIPLAEDKFGIRMSAGIDDFSGFSEAVDFPDEKNVNDGDTKYFRAKAMWQASENVDLRASYMHIETDMGFNNVVEILEPPTIGAGGGLRGFTSAETDLFNFTLNWSLGFADLVSTTTYLDHYGPFGIGFGAAPVNGSVLSSTDATGTSQEVRLVSNSDSPSSWIAGFLYNDSEAKFDTTLKFDWDFLQGLAGSDTVLDIGSKSYALFGEFSYDFMDGKLVPLVGLRYYEDDRTFSERGVIGSGTPSETPLPGYKSEDEFSNWNPRFNLSYYPNDSTTYWFNVAKGFRSGSQQTSVAVLAAQLDGIAADQAIEPDSVWSYELGGKWMLADDRFALEIVPYYSEFNDVQVQYITSLGLVSVITGGDSEIYGVESGLSWLTPVEGLTFSANGTVLDTEWTNVSQIVEDAVPGITEGDSVPWTPKWSYMVAAEYTRPIGNFTGYGHVAFSRRGKQFSFNYEDSATITDLSMRIGLERNNWGFYAFGDNLFDERGPALVSGSSLYTYTPRRIGLMVQVDF